MDERDDDRHFTERFDAAATMIGLALLALVAAAWIGATIWRLYY